ncbi:arylsulfatase [Opitutia bacterium ISCC 52]|nr:arylsulfatase [Opitutae bacterium ISCC 52]
MQTALFTPRHWPHYYSFKWLTLYLMLGLIASISVSILSAADTKPNVILLVSDDQGWGDVGYHGGEMATPNIDQLVKDGMELNRFYTYPICSPTRTSLLTGHISMRHKVFMPFDSDSGDHTLTHDDQLMNQAFKNAGYVTMTAGKWHLGHTHVRDFPINRGFDHTYGSLEAFPDYWTHHGRGGSKDWARDGKTVFENGYMTYLFGNEVSRLIRDRDPSKPFFSYVAFTAPHTPFQAPQAYVDKYAHVEDESRRTYCAMVEVLDVAIGNILKTIDDEGMRDNTIVMFFSDNGAGPVGDNGGFRGQKGQLYEGGTRMPAVIRWPGKIPAGIRSEQPMVVYDLFPTLVDAIGLETNLRSPFDGESVWDTLQSGKTRPRNTDIVIGTGTGYSVHSGDFKLVHSNINKNAPQNGPLELVELFKIYEDPNETSNVADAHPEVIKQLMAENAEWAALISEAPFRARGGGRGGRGGGRQAAGQGGPGGRPGVEATGGRPGGRQGGPAGGRRGGPPRSAPPVDAEGNIIHLHETVPGS